MTEIMFWKFSDGGSGVAGGNQIREFLEPGEVADDEILGGAGDQVFPFESTHDPDGRLHGQADHVGEVLAGEPDRDPDPARLLHARACREVDEQGGEALISGIESEDLGVLSWASCSRLPKYWMTSRAASGFRRSMSK